MKTLQNGEFLKNVNIFRHIVCFMSFKLNLLTRYIHIEIRGGNAFWKIVELSGSFIELWVDTPGSKYDDSMR